MGYDETDFIPCEICDNQAVDIHHIMARSKFKELLNHPNNLMALCREDHIEYGDQKFLIPLLLDIHKKRMESKGVDFNPDWFEFYKNMYG